MEISSHKVKDTVLIDRTRPTFDQLLSDPLQQLDPKSELLKSVMEYMNAPSDTVSISTIRPAG